MIEFGANDLLDDISQDELDSYTQTLSAQGDPDPIANTIAEQQARMQVYFARYVVPDGWQRSLLRCLVLWRLCFRVGSIPEKRQEAYDLAMKELCDIRDHKFRETLAPVEPADDPAIQVQRGRSGSSRRVNPGPHTHGQINT